LKKSTPFSAKSKTDFTLELGFGASIWPSGELVARTPKKAFLRLIQMWSFVEMDANKGQNDTLFLILRK
jgi:hypothetical protein